MATRRYGLLAPRDQRAIVAHRRRVDGEACGLLVGHVDPLAVVVTVPCENVAADPEHTFVVAPADLARVVTAAAALGLDVVGGYHSHPGSADPSTTDLAGFPASGWVLVIVGADEIQTWTVG